MVHKNMLEAATGKRPTACQHWDPHPVVGLSALCFGVPASTFFAVELCIFCVVKGPYEDGTLAHLFLYPLLGICYLGAIATCGFADFLYIKRGHRSLYGKVDIIWAGSVFLLSVFDFYLRASLIETCILVGLAGAAFSFSGSSTSFEQWVCRHSIWHVAGAMIGTYGALRLAPEQAHISGHVWIFILAFIGVYVLCASLALLLFFEFVPKDSRLAWWERGAKYAQWKPVAPE